MPEMTDVNKILRDSAHAAIGFGVLGFQKAQVRRRELIEQLAEQGGQAAELSRQLETLSDEVGAQLNHLGEQIGAQVGQMRSAANSASPAGSLRDQLIEVAKLLDRQVEPVRQQIDTRLSEVEEMLPAPTRDVVRSLRSAVNTQGSALRSAVGFDD